MDQYKNQNIILAVSGSISAYKAYDLCRSLVKANHQVKVILTKGALEFIKADTFKYLGATEVHGPEDDFVKSSSNNILHIELSKWANKIIVAPLSASTLSRIAHGDASDLLGSILLTFKRSVLLFPAMNTKMLEAAIVQKNFETCRELLKYYVHRTENGVLACGDEGLGKLVSVEEISELAPIINVESNTLASKHFLLTAGATIAPLDSVRYMTNPATGLTAYEMSKEILASGHQVTIVAGLHSTEKLNYLNFHPLAKVVRVVTANEMHQAVMNHFSSADVYISTAAISDIEFDVSSKKIKKSDLKNSLPIKMGIDILEECLKIKRQDQVVIGFAAETDLSFKVLKEKWDRKKVDFLIGTKVAGFFSKDLKIEGFQNDEASYHVLKNGETFDVSILNKKDLYKKMLGDFLHA